MVEAISSRAPEAMVWALFILTSAVLGYKCTIVVAFNEAAKAKQLAFSNVCSTSCVQPGEFKDVLSTRFTAYRRKLFFLTACSVMRGAHTRATLHLASSALERRLILGLSEQPPFHVLLRLRQSQGTGQHRADHRRFFPLIFVFSFLVYAAFIDYLRRN